MNRQQRREKARQARTFDERKNFAPDEVRDFTEVAYSLGVDHALEAIALVYGLGEIRLARIKQKLEMLQILDFQQADRVKWADKLNVHRVKINRAQRRAQQKSKKGAVLNYE